MAYYDKNHPLGGCIYFFLNVRSGCGKNCPETVGFSTKLAFRNPSWKDAYCRRRYDSDDHKRVVIDDEMCLYSYDIETKIE